MAKVTTTKNLAVGLVLLVLGAIPGVPLQADQQPSIDKLQRLFTTAYERAQLDAMRRRGGQGQADAEPSIKPALPPAEVKIKGLVKRQNNPNVVWINDKNTLKSEKVDERTRVQANRVSQDNRIPIVIDGRRVKLKPGQVWNEIDHQIRDSYQIKTTKSPSAGVAEESMPEDNK